MDLMDAIGSIDSSKITKFDGSSFSDREAWTGASADGDFAEYNCNDWTTNDLSVEAHMTDLHSGGSLLSNRLVKCHRLRYVTFFANIFIIKETDI